MGHEDNFSAWLKKQGSCPACRIPFDDDKFDTIELKDGTINELYLEKSSVYFKRKQIFNSFSFKLPYYDFQNYVVSDIIDQMQFDASHLLIAPPGSGKTIVGLSVVSYFKVNTLVLVPNLAVLGSWIDRLDMFYDQAESSIKLPNIYTRSTGDLKPITITTYQQINTSLKSYIPMSEIGKGKFQTVDSSLNFITRLRNHEIGLIILDEAHRLTGKWGQDIKELLNQLGEVKMLGLTATPPQKVDEEFDDIFEDRKTVIPLPMLVREGVLSPFRDLALIFPSKRELSQLLTELNSPSLDEDGTKDNVLSDDVKIKTKFDNFEYIKLKKELVNRTIHELEFLNNYNDGDISNYSIRWLASNLSYLTQLSIDIILMELNHLKDDFRGLILLEQETVPKALPKDKKGTGGAIGIFESVLKIPEIDEIDPIFVTGKSLLIDKDFVELFQSIGGEWIKLNHLEFQFSYKKTQKKYAIINGSGKDWNTDTYTRYVTYLFEQGHSKLLIGTRFLLGEGWDSLSLNTVVDLTTFTTYAFVNQVKGRALRKNPNNPDKVSHMWEIAPNPHLTSESMREFENYKKRHEIYFGIDSRGSIRNGIDRLNHNLRPNVDDYTKLLSRIDYDSQIRDLRRILVDRPRAKELWKVGQKLGDLFFALRFDIKVPKRIVNVNSDKMKNLLIDSLKKLIQIGVNNFFVGEKLEPYDIIINKHENNFNIKILIPIKAQFNEISQLEEKLKGQNTINSIGIVITSHIFARTIFLPKILSLIGLTQEAEAFRYFIKLPWNLSLIEENNLVHIDDLSFSDYVIENVLTTNLNLNIVDKIDVITKQNNLIENSEIQIIQKFDKSKTSGLIGPKIDKTEELKIVNLLIDQEYVDL